MHMHLINYFVRGLIFLIGFLMLFRVGLFSQRDELLTTGMGIILILFGALRLITYYQATHKFKDPGFSELVEKEDEDEEDNDK